MRGSSLRMMEWARSLRVAAGVPETRGPCPCSPKSAFWNEFNPARSEAGVRGVREAHMTDEGLGRRDFLKGAVVGGAAAATVNLPQSAEAQQPAAAPASPADATSPGYSF